MMRKKSFLIVEILFVLLTSTFGMAQSGDKPKVSWNEVIAGKNNTQTIQIKEVRMYTDRTELSVHVDYPSGYWIRVRNDMYLQTDGRKYPLTGATVVTIGEQFWMPNTGEVDFDLIFAPLPTDCQRIDFIEPNGWEIWNIRSADFQPKGIEDTYWREEATGDWLIGFTSECVIYAGKFWDIVSLSEKKDTYQLIVTDGSVNLPVKVGKMKKGIRLIEISGLSPVACSPITTSCLPDYPQKDMRQGIKDNGYRMDETVTFVGWLKDMPEDVRKMKSEFEISYESVFSNENENAYAKMDSLGRFSITMPLINSTQVFLDWQRTTLSTVFEPGETYFFLYDFETGQQLFMGKNVRLQNELIAHPHSWKNLRIASDERGNADAMKAWKDADEIRAKQMEELQNLLKMHPNLSQRYIDYVEGYYLTMQGEGMMQARFHMSNMELPQAYMEYVGKEFWQKRLQPYTLYRDFGTFMADYLSQLIMGSRSMSAVQVVQMVLHLEKNGEVSLTDQEREYLKQYPEMIAQVQKEINNASEEEQQVLANTFNNSEMVKNVNGVLSQYNEVIKNEIQFRSVHLSIEAIDSIGCDKTLRDIHIARLLYRAIDGLRKPLPNSMIKLMEEEISLPIAKKTVLDLHEKYLAIQNRNVSYSSNLKSNDEVKDMSDGEKILRKLIEPYKGKIILLDIWGTWCGPCKAALSHSQEEYERLKPYDMVFLYLANRSNDESWKNVIKEYNVMGDNVVHYNLPAEQQSAVENFLKVNSFPTYKLIDEDGNILDVNADPRDLNGLEQLIKSMKGRN